MGLGLDGETFFNSLQQGPPEAQDDPLGSALLWYIDLIFQHETIPTDPVQICKWVLTQSEIVRDGIRRFAEAISASVDDSFPVKWKGFPIAPKNLEVEIVCSEIRSIEARQLKLILLGFATDLEDYVKQLSASSYEPLLR